MLTPTDFGGGEKVSLNLLESIDRDAFDIFPVLYTRPWEEPPLFARELDRLGYEYRTIPVSLKQGDDRFRIPRMVESMYSILRSGQFRIAHANGYFADICTLPVARALRIETVATCHGFIEGDRRLKLYNYLDRKVLRLANRIIAVSEDLRSMLITEGIAEDRISVLPNAVPVPENDSGRHRFRTDVRDELDVADDELVVGYLGRLSEEKGIRFLVEAVSLLIRETDFNLRLLIVGDGPEYQELQDLAEALGLSDRVALVGFQAEPQRWLSAFDIFALPSLTEGTPMALLEAMAAQRPIVATNVGGVPDVVTDGEDGLLVAPGDARGLAEALRRVTHDSGLGERLAAKAADTVRARYGLTQWCRTIEGHYRSVLGRA